MSFILLMMGPDLPGPDDPFEFCLTRIELTSLLLFFNMFISFFSNFLHTPKANTLFYMDITFLIKSLIRQLEA